MGTTIDSGGSIAPDPSSIQQPVGPPSQTGTGGIMDVLMQLFNNNTLPGSPTAGTTQTSSTGVISGTSTLSELPSLDTTISVGTQAATTPSSSSPILRSGDANTDPLSNRNVGKALSSNPWLQRNALANILNMMMEIMVTERRGQLAEALKAVETNSALWDMTAEKVKVLNEQGQLMLAKAIAEFAVSIASAAVSVGVAVATTKSDKKAEEKIRKETEELKFNPKTGQPPEGGVAKYMEDKKQLAVDKTRRDNMPEGPEKTKLSKEIEQREQDIASRQPGYAQIKEFQKENGLTVEPSPLQKKENEEQVVLKEVPQKNEEKYLEKNTNLNKEDLKELNNLSETSKSRYDKLAPNGYLDTKNPEVQKRIDDTMRLDSTKYAAINDVNSKVSQAINQLLEGAFGMAQKQQEALMAGIDQWLSALRMNLDAARESRNSITQDLNSNLSAMRDLIGSWWQGVGSYR